MPQSLARVLVHYVFSTKDREVMIGDDWREHLHAYIGGIIREMDGSLLKAGSVGDHIHLLVAQPRTKSMADLVREIKVGSVKWIKARFPGGPRFQWQGGYGAFSISPNHRIALEEYIENQAEHHRKVTFQDEYRRLLEKYGIKYDEQYVWD